MSDIIDKPIRKKTKSDVKKQTSAKKSKSALSSTDQTLTTSSSTSHVPMMVAPSLLEDGEFDETIQDGNNLDWLNDLHSEKGERIEPNQTSEKADEPAAFKARKTPRLPLYNQNVINGVSEMFPQFKEAVRGMEGCRDLVDHFNEMCETKGTLDIAEQAEYQEAYDALVKAIKSARQMLVAFDAVKVVEGSTDSGEQSTNKATTPFKDTRPSEHVTVFQQQLRDHPGTLVNISNEEIKLFRRKFATAKQQVPTLDRGGIYPRVGKRHDYGHAETRWYHHGGQSF